MWIGVLLSRGSIIFLHRTDVLRPTGAHPPFNEVATVLQKVAFGDTKLNSYSLSNCLSGGPSRPSQNSREGGGTGARLPPQPGCDSLPAPTHVTWPAGKSGGPPDRGSSGTNVGRGQLSKQVFPNTTASFMPLWSPTIVKQEGKPKTVFTVVSVST